MLWLNKKSIQDVSINDYTRIVQKQNFCIRKILEYSKKSCVFLTSKNTVIKVLNPDLSKYQFKNFIRANTIFLKYGIKTPRILSVKRSSDFYIIENQYISPQLFFEKKPLMKADEAFFNIFDRLSKIEIANFGPLITQKNFLPQAFINCDYLQYWDNQLNYFLAKISNKAFCQRVKQFYKILRARVKKPDKFILSHSDISPKHIFMYRSQIGCIDLEESMYLDASFMWAIWYVRTVHERTRKSSNIFFKQFFLRNLDFNLFKFHFYRELLIQYYYQKLLNKFLKDYSKLSINFNLLTKLTK
jgi:hypothetical protein